MYLLELEKLQKGDIILLRSDSGISEIIRKLTKSQYSHGILYVGNGSIIDSDGYGVQANNVHRKLISKVDDVLVLRLKEITNKVTLIRIEDFARSKIGTEYATDEARIAMLNKELKAKKPNRQFCTRFIAQAYSYAGIKLVENADYCIPEELLNSDYLQIIDGITRKASESEIEFAKSENPLEKQVKIHNSIFTKARELSGCDVQTFEQISEMLIEKPEFDKELTEFISNSGYLTMMDEDADRNPWHYDANKMIEYYKDPNQIVAMAINIASGETQNRSRLNISIFAFNQLNKKHPREYYKMEIELYRKLIDYSRKREYEAIKVLKYF
jgi:hypothetical protein